MRVSSVLFAPLSNIRSLFWEELPHETPRRITLTTIFPGEIYRAPRRWAEQNFHKLIYWNEVDKGGHFAAWEQPELLSAELRAAFKPLRKST